MVILRTTGQIFNRRNAIAMILSPSSSQTPNYSLFHRPTRQSECLLQPSIYVTISSCNISMPWEHGLLLIRLLPSPQASGQSFIHSKESWKAPQRLLQFCPPHYAEAEPRVTVLTWVPCAPRSPLVLQWTVGSAAYHNGYLYTLNIKFSKARKICSRENLKF